MYFLCSSDVHGFLKGQLGTFLNHPFCSFLQVTSSASLPLTMLSGSLYQKILLKAEVWVIEQACSVRWLALGQVLFVCVYRLRQI